MNMHKTGVMGGTFNPIHYGHLLIAENACEQYGLDQIIFMPAGNPPHKNNQDVLDAAHRSAMVKTAIADNPHFVFSDYEITKTSTCYTYQTLEDLSGLFPDSQLYFVMGADSLAYFGSWKRPERISELATILAAVRDSLDRDDLLSIRGDLAKQYGTRVNFINTPNFSVSSRMIRQRVRERRSIRYLVPDAVEQYITDQELYR